jgi:hypothetical protein
VNNLPPGCDWRSYALNDCLEVNCTKTKVCGSSHLSTASSTSSG